MQKNTVPSLGGGGASGLSVGALHDFDDFHAIDELFDVLQVAHVWRMRNARGWVNEYVERARGGFFAPNKVVTRCATASCHYSHNSD
jgi:hypothetical protein